MSDAPVRGYRLVIRVVLLQAGCTLLVASLFFAFKGTSSGLAALAGGLIVATGTALFGWRAFAPGVAGGAVLNRRSSLPVSIIGLVPITLWPNSSVEPTVIPGLIR